MADSSGGGGNGKNPDNPDERAIAGGNKPKDGNKSNGKTGGGKK